MTTRVSAGATAATGPFPYNSSLLARVTGVVRRPDRTFRDRLTIGRGLDQVDLYYFGPAHTNGDAVVVFPAVRVMHTGDLFLWKGPPLVDVGSGGSGVAYPETKFE